MNKKDISPFITRAIKSKLKLSLLLFINDMTSPPSYDEKALITNELIRERNKAAKTLSALIKDSESDREAFCVKLSKLNRKTIDAYRPTQKMTASAELANDLISYEAVLRSVTSQDYSGISSNEILDMLHDMLHEMEEPDKSNCFTLLMSAMPCRMTGKIFEDYVKDSVIAKAGEETEYQSGIWYIDFIRNKCIPFEDKDFQEAYPDQYGAVKELIEKKLSDLSDEELSEKDKLIREELNLAYETSDRFSMIYNDISYMLILALYGYDIDFCSGDDLLLKDYFFSAVRLGCTENPDEIDRELMDKIYEASSELAEKAIDEDNDIVNNYKNNISLILKACEENEQLSHMNSIYTSVCHLYRSEIDDVLSLKPENEAFDPKAEGDALAAEINSAMAALPPYNKKSIRRLVIENLICPYSEHKVLDYTADTFSYYGENSRSNLLYALCINLLDDHSHREEHHNHHHHHHHDCC